MGVKTAPLAQLDRASDYESAGRGFESLRARHLGNLTFKDSNKIDKNKLKFLLVSFILLKQEKNLKHSDAKMKILYSLFIFVFSLIISTQAWADKAYVIKKGDSLYSISKKFKIEIDSIKKANEIVSDKLAPGTKLIIPSAESNIKKSIH